MGRTRDVGSHQSGKSGPGPARLERIEPPPATAAPDTPHARTTASYLAEITAELESLASAAKLELLAYLLAMARTEAEAIARAPEDE